MTTGHRAAVAAALLLPLTLATPATPAAAPPAEPLAQLAWLAGTWVSPRDSGNRGEETWSRPAGDSILGMFRLQTPTGETRFVELQTITAEGRELVLRIRHFSPQLAPWEGAGDGPLTYRSTQVGPGEIRFTHPTDDVRHIIYTRTDAKGRPAALRIRLVRLARDGTTKHQDFEFRLATTPPSGAPQ